MFLGPLDPLLALFYAAFKLRRGRVLLLALGLGPAVLYALPAQPCGCFRTPFVRCSGGGRALAYRAAMKSDLKNLESQQEIYFSDHGAYSARVEDLAFVSSDGVHVTMHATDEGWAARATHDALGVLEGCAMYNGDAPAHGIDELAGTGPGELACTF